ncbi:phage EaA protein [Klebsiella pneumoniae]|uniref:ead/Ea22-like family protein n=1 Tax=Klebsiella pneumoniae TaxID=573 RepID=UPI000808AE4D|nr:ead/Ea22-like family protein [Klebsiella pneumoniae]SBX82831.1 phage EaA protein [Klebsiella pneumoniae]
MTDITELAQRMKTAAEKLDADQWQTRKGFSGIEVIVKGSLEKGHGCVSFQPVAADMADTKTARAIALFSPANVLALVEALEKAQQRNAELEAQNEYIRKRYQQLDLLIGKNILVMQAAIIEWQATGDAKNGLAWIYNTLFGPGELPDEAEKDAQAYFDRKYAPLDEELMALHKWFWEQSEAERAAAGIKVEAE